MHVIINGESRELTNDLTLTDLIETLGFTNTRIAIEVDGAIVPRSQYAHYTIQPENKIEIIQAVGGG